MLDDDGHRDTVSDDFYTIESIGLRANESMGTTPDIIIRSRNLLRSQSSNTSFGPNMQQKENCYRQLRTNSKESEQGI